MQIKSANLFEYAKTNKAPQKNQTNFFKYKSTSDIFFPIRKEKNNQHTKKTKENVAFFNSLNY